MAVRTANDALAQRREMNDRDLGAENIERMQQGYRSNPKLLGLDQPPAQLSELPDYDPTRTEGGVPNRYDTVYSEVQTGSGEPIVRFSGPTTEDEIIARRGAQPNIYQRMYGGVKDLLSPLPTAPKQAPTYSTPSYPVPSEGGSAATNRLIDRAFNTVLGNSLAAAPAQAAVAPAPAPAQEYGEPGFSGEQGKILHEVKYIKKGLDDIINNTNYITSELKEKTMYEHSGSYKFRDLKSIARFSFFKKYWDNVSRKHRGRFM
jgi:hypothetical protein